MKIRIDVNTDNAAFQDNFEGEMRRIMHTAAQWIASNRFVNDKPFDLRDINGNKVGEVVLEYDINEIGD